MSGMSDPLPAVGFQSERVAVSREGCRLTGDPIECGVSLSCLIRAASLGSTADKRDWPSGRSFRRGAWLPPGAPMLGEGSQSASADDSGRHPPARCGRSSGRLCRRASGRDHRLPPHHQPRRLEFFGRSLSTPTLRPVESAFARLSLEIVGVGPRKS